MTSTLTHSPFRPGRTREEHAGEVRVISSFVVFAYGLGMTLMLMGEHAHGTLVVLNGLGLLTGLVSAAVVRPSNAHQVERAVLLINLVALVSLSLQGGTVGTFFYYIAAVVHIAYSERARGPRTLLLAAYLLGAGATVVYLASAAYVPAELAYRFRVEYVDATLAIVFICYNLRRFRRYNLRAHDELSARERVLDMHVREWREGREALLRKAREIEQLKAASRLSIERERVARAQIEAQGEEMRQFAYAASHDLKEPVRTIRSFVQMTRRRLPADYALPAESAEFFDHIDASTATMATLLDRLLAYSRAERAPTDPKPTTPTRLFYAVSTRERVRIDPTPEPLTGLGLPVVRERFDAILAELVDNALRFSDSETPVTVGIRECATGAEVYVRDRGIGIAPEYAERVFGLFQRLHARDAYPGHGIGLALCRRLLGGEDERLRLHPVEGGGTEAVLTL